MVPPRKPRYEGEDVSPTTSRELRGFYAYSIAAEVYAVCGIGMDICILNNFQSANEHQDPSCP